MSKIVKKLGGRLRVRACGLYIEGDSILLANHKGLNRENMFWSPPGGGVEFGESAEEAVLREFHEETSSECDPA